jgi:Helicase associated domain
MAPPPSFEERVAEYKHIKENGLSIGSGGLSAWMYRQRTANADGTLSDERKEKLNSVGFQWIAIAEGRNPYDHDAWNNNFTLLEKHHLENGCCRGPYDDKRLGQWVKNQRFAFKNKESLTEIQQERWTRLKTLGFWGATELQGESPGSAGRGSDAALRASRATASADSRSSGKKGQRLRDRGKVSHRLLLPEQATTRTTKPYIAHPFTCISKPVNGNHIGNQVCTLFGPYLARLSCRGL